MLKRDIVAVGFVWFLVAAIALGFWYALVTTVISERRDHAAQSVLIGRSVVAPQLDIVGSVVWARIWDGELVCVAVMYRDQQGHLDERVLPAAMVHISPEAP